MNHSDHGATALPESSHAIVNFPPERLLPLLTLLNQSGYRIPDFQDHAVADGKRDPQNPSQPLCHVLVEVVHDNRGLPFHQLRIFYVKPDPQVPGISTSLGVTLRHSALAPLTLNSLPHPPGSLRPRRKILNPPSRSPVLVSVDGEDFQRVPESTFSPYAFWNFYHLVVLMEKASRKVQLKGPTSIGSSLYYDLVKDSLRLQFTEMSNQKRGFAHDDALQPLTYLEGEPIKNRDGEVVDSNFRLIFHHVDPASHQYGRATVEIDVSKGWNNVSVKYPKRSRGLGDHSFVRDLDLARFAYFLQPLVDAATPQQHRDRTPVIATGAKEVPEARPCTSNTPPRFRRRAAKRTTGSRSGAALAGRP